MNAQLPIYPSNTDTHSLLIFIGLKFLTQVNDEFQIGIQRELGIPNNTVREILDISKSQ